MTADATSVKAIHALRQCYNSLNVSHSAHRKKCLTCVFLVIKKSTESWINVKKTGAYLPKILEMNQSFLQAQYMETKGNSWTV